jgi:hypothetical protein
MLVDGGIFTPSEATKQFLADKPKTSAK